jgi:hypothetical protein
VVGQSAVDVNDTVGVRMHVSVCICAHDMVRVANPVVKQKA